MRTVVIGAGWAGLSAAIRLLEAGEPVTLISKSPGGLQLSQGSVDLLGYTPERVTNPMEACAALPEGHPYRTVSAETIRESLTWMQNHLDLSGNVDENMFLPTAVGAVRPTALAPRSLAAADVRNVKSFAVVGVRELKDFQADLIAGNLARTTFDGTQLQASSSWIEFEPREREVDPSTIHFAQALDDPARLEQFAALVKKTAGEGDIVLVPAVIGLRNPEAWDKFVELLGRPAAEVSTQPPNIPGIRMFNSLLQQARDLGLRHTQGAFATDYSFEGDKITGITVNSGSRPHTVRCEHVVYAPGGFESGAITVDSEGAIHERLFDLKLTADSTEGLMSDDLWGPQPLFDVGVTVDEQMRPSAPNGPSFTNLHVAGGLIAGAQRWHEKSGDGIAIATGVQAANTILGGK